MLDMFGIWATPIVRVFFFFVIVLLGIAYPLTSASFSIILYPNYHSLKT